MSQSTNDTIHAAIHIAAVEETHKKLLPSLELLEKSLRKKAGEFDKAVKCGRTHLQDAVPVRLGQVFGAYATMIAKGRKRVENGLGSLFELCIGGTAVGTGLNTPPGYRERVIKHINDLTGFEFYGAADMIEAMQSLDAVVDFAGSLRVVAVGFKKIADDFRLMGSGPRTGLREIELPPVQPGSSIMPGKVNPVMAEMLNMVSLHAMGCDETIVSAAEAGQLELNVMMPVIAYNLLQEIEILSSGAEAFALKCVRGVKANEDTMLLYAQKSAALATALSPLIGYHRAAELSREALEKDVLLRDLVKKKKLLSDKELDRLLDLRAMTERLCDKAAVESGTKRRKLRKLKKPSKKKKSR